MTLAEVAEYLKLSQKTLLKMVNNKEIPCTKIANQWRFSKIMLDDWLLSKMQVIPQNDLSRLIEQEYDFVPLSRLVAVETINCDIKARTRDEALEELADMAETAHLIKKKTLFLKQLIERENMISTSLDHGVAIPHLRKPSPELVNEPRIIIGISKLGIDFNSSDGSKCHVFFLLISDSELVHLRILSRITQLLRKKTSLERIKGFKKEQEFIEFFMSEERQ
jgi:PTS system nitrogen regulatory IIA component